MFLNGHDDEVADMLRNDYRRKQAARFTGDRETGRSADECTDAGSDDGHRRGDGLEVGGAVGVDEDDVLLGGRCRLADGGGKDGVAARRGRTTGVGGHGSGGDVDDGQAARGRPHVLIGGCGEGDGLTAGRRADSRRDGGGESVGCEGLGELVGGHGGTCAVGSGDGAVDGAGPGRGRGSDGTLRGVDHHRGRRDGAEEDPGRTGESTARQGHRRAPGRGT